MKNTCENCQYYGFFDSGYGYCRRYPPKEIIIKKNLFKTKIEQNYPLVAWCQSVCGEFKHKDRKS